MCMSQQKDLKLKTVIEKHGQNKSHSSTSWEVQFQEMDTTIKIYATHLEASRKVNKTIFLTDDKINKLLAKFL